MKIYHNVYGYRSQYATKKFPLMKKNVFFKYSRQVKTIKNLQNYFQKFVMFSFFRAALYKFIFVFYKGSFVPLLSISNAKVHKVRTRS